MLKNRKKTLNNPTLQAAETTSRRGLIGVIIAAAIAGVGGITVALINGWFGSGKLTTIQPTGIYRVRVTVTNPQNIPVEDAKVWSSFGGESKQVAGGWQFDIPDGSKPLGGHLYFYALRESDSLTGQADLILNTDYNPAVTIKLNYDDSAKLHGQVVDGNNNAIVGARVFVVGYENEIIITKQGGNFELPAHAALGEMVNLHVEKSGYRSVSQEHPAGNHPATLVLEKIR